MHSLFQTAALPVCRDLLPLIMKNATTETTAVTNQRSMLTRSTHTAFFILLTPPFAGFA